MYKQLTVYLATYVKIMVGKLCKIITSVMLNEDNNNFKVLYSNFQLTD